MKIHHLTADEALASLHTTSQGLTAREAQRRLVEFGPNRIERRPETPLIWRFVATLTHFFAIILWVAAGLAFVAEHYDPGNGMATLGFAILGVIVINGVFSFGQEYRAERALAALQRLLPNQVKALRDGVVHLVAADDLVPGDVILLDDGDEIPADCRILTVFAARVNHATITGESVPLARDAKPSAEEQFLHSRNALLAGTALVSGQVRAVVCATGMRTEFGRIAHLSQHARAPLSPLQQEIARLSRLVAVLATALGVGFFLIGRVVGLSFWENFLFAIGIIVANVPEGLLPTVTLALAMGAQRMARRNALIRHLPAVETLGSATVICTDKTGTLTQNRMAVRKLLVPGRDGGLADALQVPEPPVDHHIALEVALHCHTLKETDQHGKKAFLGDPMEVALVEMARAILHRAMPFPQVSEVPFDSDRKRLSTLHRTPTGLVLYTKGALEALLPLCSHIQLGAEVQPLTPAWHDKLLRAQDILGEEGLRILALAYRVVSENTDSACLEEELTLAGLVGLEDPPRREVPAAIARCKQAGIRVIMTTGDHPHTAQAVGRQIGLFESMHPVVITGDQLRRLSDTQLQLALRNGDIVFARVAADQKLRVVLALKAQRHVVAVTGDGVNDAPALRGADIGIAMGEAGTDVARAAADMVLLDDNFASIVAAIEEGRAVFANIRKFLTYILTSNVPELVPYLAFVLCRIPLALTVIQILAVDLGTDMVPALALGAEPPDPESMRQPPHTGKGRLMDRALLLRSYLFLGILEAAGAMAVYALVLVRGGWRYGEAMANDALLYRQATTACLSAIILLQVANLFVCRSERASAFAVGLFRNPLILIGIAAELTLIFLIDYTPQGNALFATAPLPGWIWLCMVPFALIMFVLEEGRKWLVRRRARTPPRVDNGSVTPAVTPPGTSAVSVAGRT